MSKWTSFYDMSSGGKEKTPYNIIYIEAPEEVALTVFTKLFDRDPNNVTCSCCGPDFSVREHESAEGAIKYYRGDVESAESHFKRSYVKAVFRPEVLKLLGLSE